MVLKEQVRSGIGEIGRQLGSRKRSCGFLVENLPITPLELGRVATSKLGYLWAARGLV